MGTIQRLKGRKKMVLVYHHNDLDGCASAAIVNEHERDSCYNKMCDYKKHIPGLDTFHYIRQQTNRCITKIYIVDYSFTKDTIYQLEELLTLDIPVIWIDHHSSSIEYIHSNLTRYINTDYCGAYNTYKLLINENIPLSIQLVDSWDCFKFNVNNTLQFKYYFDTLNFKEIISTFRQLLNDETLIDEYIHIGNYLKTLIDNQYSINRNNAYEINLMGYKCLMCNSFMKSSLLFGDMLDDYDIGIIYVYNGKTYNYSIYTTKINIQCDKIAEKFGGGGHPQAAGFTLNYLLQ